jgi:hypothetical protein
MNLGGFVFCGSQGRQDQQTQYNQSKNNHHEFDLCEPALFLPEASFGHGIARRTGTELP